MGSTNRPFNKLLGSTNLLGKLTKYSSIIKDEYSNQYFKKFQTMRYLEILTILSIIFYPITFIFAILWFIFYSSKDIELCLFLRHNSNYKPQTEQDAFYYSIITNDQLISKIARFNKTKRLLMIILAIPLLGSLLFIMFSIITLGILPLYLISEKKRPEKYIKSMTRGTHFSNIRGYVRPVTQPVFQQYSSEQASIRSSENKNYEELTKREITQLKGMLKVEKEISLNDIARMFEREESKIKLAIYEIVGSEKTDIAIDGNIVRMITPRITRITSINLENVEDEESNLCQICSTEIFKGEDFAACPHCDNIFHISHIEEWLKQKELCPVCRNNLNFDNDIIIVNAKKR